jgi:uncharacterized protein (TIGR02246 family)
MSVLAALSLAVTLLCAGSAAAGMHEEDVAAINKVREMENEGTNSGDPEKGVRAYADDIVFMPPGEQQIKGKDAVRGWLEAMWEQFDLDLVYTSAEITVSGDWASERYYGKVTLTPKAGGDTLKEEVKGIHIYRRGEDGSWRIVNDIWNAYVPPPAKEY